MIGMIGETQQASWESGVPGPYLYGGASGVWEVTGDQWPAERRDLREKDELGTITSAKEEKSRSAPFAKSAKNAAPKTSSTFNLLATRRRAAHPFQNRKGRPPKSFKLIKGAPPAIRCRGDLKS